VRLQNEKPSSNFVDDSFRVAQGLLQRLKDSVDPRQQMDVPEHLPPNVKNVYGKWLGQNFDDITPHELDLMKTHGMSFRDIAVLREMQRGEILYPYGSQEIRKNFKE
jgi:hypothetical protein